MESKAYNSYVILYFRRRVKPTTPTLFYSFDGEQRLQLLRYSIVSTESKAYNPYVII